MKRWYWDYRGMEPWELGRYVLRQDMIDALADYGAKNGVDDPQDLCAAFGVTLDEYRKAGGS